LRTPLLPAGAWPFAAAASDTHEERRARIRALIADPAVREAVFVASPDLDDAIAAWLDTPDNDRGQRVERSLARYLARMAWRPTPFGLFAGVTVGTIASQNRTRLELRGRGEYRRHTRLDTGYLDSLAQAVA